jgi:hypothetical protein
MKRPLHHQLALNSNLQMTPRQELSDTHTPSKNLSTGAICLYHLYTTISSLVWGLDGRFRLWRNSSQVPPLAALPVDKG